MIQFHAPDIEQSLTLPENDSGHAVRVLRLRQGDNLTVVDGKGKRFLCRLVDPHPKHARVEIISAEEVPLFWKENITLAVAPTKNIDRMEWLLEKATEIGLNSFVPLLCRHNERREIKAERIEKIVVAAMKQSLKAVMPSLEPMTPFSDFVKRFADDDVALKYICYCDENTPRLDLARDYQPGRDAVILIGPEGDFSPEEVKIAIDVGFKPVTLGDNRLRTETAALYALSTIHVVNQLNSNE